MERQSQKLPVFYLLALIASVGTGCREAGRETGVLLGLSSAHTLWITFRGDSARLAADVTPLLVPRADGFWWVGSERRCVIADRGDEFVGSQEFVDEANELYVARPGDTVTLALDGIACAAAEDTLLASQAGRDSAGGVDSLPEGDRTERRRDELYCVQARRELSFVSADIIAERDRISTSEFCSPAHYETLGRNVVRRFGTTTEVALRPLLPPQGQSRLQHVLDTVEVDCTYLDQESDTTWFDTTWTVQRVPGGWQVAFWLNGGNVCRGGTAIDWDPPPPSLVAAPLPVPSDTSPPALNAHDVAAVPGGRVLEVGYDSIWVRAVDRGIRGRVLLAVPIHPGEDIIMIRPGDAEETARWNREIPAVRQLVIRVVSPRR